MQGIIVVFIGADGAGKSTLSEDVLQELSKKVDVLHIYMGMGEGTSSWFRWPLKKIRDFNSPKYDDKIPKKKKNRRNINRKNTRGFKNFFSKIFNILWAVSLAWEKEMKLKKALRAKKRGWCVITDRYPQTQIEGENDGPRINLLGIPGLKMLADWEKKKYSISNDVPPDLVFLLHANEEILKERKPEMSISKLKTKQSGLMKLKFSSKTNLVKIDTSQDYSVVRNLCISYIEEALMSNNHGL